MHRDVDIVRLGPESEEARRDRLAVEAPLEIRIDCNTLAITMRTPGHDDELAAGFLYAEGVISSGAEIARIVSGEGEGETVNVVPSPDAAVRVVHVMATKRGTLTTSSCGVCGRQAIDDLLARCESFPSLKTVPAALIHGCMEQLRANQTLFDETGGSHAAALFDSNGGLLVCREDVGRHNAVDKAVGALLLGDELDRAHVLVVSGRSSFEIVQKAIVARIQVVASVSAPSSLAVDLARRANLSLFGFVRDGSANRY